MTDDDLSLCEVTVTDVGANDHPWLLSNGFCEDYTGYWTQGRATRIDLDKYKESKTARRLSKNCIVTFGDYAIDRDVEMLYDAYARHKGFVRVIPISAYDGCNQLRLYVDGALVSVAFMGEPGEHMASYQFVTDYSRPDLSLGSVSQMMECTIAKQLGAKYLYIGFAYETSCLYKTKIRGLEWWTGRVWSDNMDQLEALILSDGV